MWRREAQVATSKAKQASEAAADKTPATTGGQPAEPATTTASSPAPQEGSGPVSAPQEAGGPVTDAAPIEPPEAKKARSPHLGRPDSSTNPIAANAALRSPTGSNHRRLVTEDGTAIELTDLFEFPAGDEPRMVA